MDKLLFSKEIYILQVSERVHLKKAAPMLC